MSFWEATLVATAGSFIATVFLLDKTLSGPLDSFVFIRRILGVNTVNNGEYIVYSGSFTSKLLGCHYCLSPYTAALMSVIVGIAAKVSLIQALGAYIVAIAGTIILFEALRIEYE